MRVLAVSYFFPPIGGAGVQRNLRLVAQLSNLGCEMAVLAGPVESLGRWSPLDAGLAAETPPEITVHRVSTEQPSSSRALRGRLERIARIRSKWSNWWTRGILDEGGRAAADDCDLIWALMQPYDSARPVAQLASSLSVPWIADLADPWALDEMVVYPSSLHRRLAMREMRLALASAAGIVMNTPEAARRLTESFPELASSPIAVIPVGWDRRDFSGPRPQRLDDAFRIVHTGYLHTELGHSQRRRARARQLLGGTRDGVDILARSHVYLLRALDALSARRPELIRRVELHLAGVQSAADRDASRDLAGVHMLGYIDHPAAVALIRSADLLFLPMHDVRDGSRASIVPGKTYEYMASGRPILAAVPDGDARDILTEVGTARLCRPTSVSCMADALEAQIDAFLVGERERAPDRQVIERYEYARLGRELARFFEDVATRGASPR